MNKLKQLLRRWLGVDEYKKEFIELSKSMRYNDELNERWCERLEKRLGKTEDIIGLTARAGFDHHIRQQSWMVVAWRDKDGRERVHFYEVHQNYIARINDMLRCFKRENVIIDTRPQIHPQFKW